MHESMNAESGATQRLLIGIWREVFERDDIAPDQDLFELGGDSLAALRIMTRVEEEWHVELQLADVFEHQTIQALARHIEALRDGGGHHA